MIFKLTKFVIALFIFATTQVRAEEVSVNVTGRGMSYNSAVLDGLKQAIAQVTGITIDAQALYGIEESIQDVHKDGIQTGYSKLSQSSQSGVASHVNGYISGYNVLSSSKEDNLYVVDMNVDIEKYTAPGFSNNRYKLAVVGITSNKGKSFNGYLSASAIQDEATQKLVSAFTATRKFSVLDKMCTSNGQKDSLAILKKTKFGR